jgi:hypothetical protein
MNTNKRNVRLQWHVELPAVTEHADDLIKKRFSDEIYVSELGAFVNKLKVIYLPVIKNPLVISF